MSKRPDILVIITDQQRRDTLLGGGVSGFCRTPHLDRLAAESVVLSNHYTNAPLCVPARNALITSTWPPANGAVVNGWSSAERPFGTMRVGVETLYEALVRVGYEVVHMGVDHLRATPPLSEREGIRFCASVEEHRRVLAERGVVPPGREVRTPAMDFERGRAVTLTYTNPTPVPWEGPRELFFDLWLAERAAEEIERRGDGGRPRALFVNFWAPHCPISCPQPYFSLYDPAEVPLPEEVGEYPLDRPPLNLLNTCGTTCLNFPPEAWRRTWAVYLGMVTLVDEAVGRVLEAVRRTGRWDETLIWMTSDHGEMLGCHGLFQKMCMYEPAVRVACMVKPPADAGAEPRIVEALTQHLDIAPTILDYADAPPLETASRGPEAGMSLRLLLDRNEPLPQRTIVITYDGNSGRGFHQRAVVDSRFKLIHNHGIQAEDPPGRFPAELYDLSRDPTERHNCLNDPSQAEETAAEQLLALLIDWMGRVNDLIPAPGPDVLRPSLPEVD